MIKKLEILPPFTPGNPTGTEIWTAGNNGISVFRNGQWVSYNTYDNPNGLISNDIYKFAVDSRGQIWVSTAAGLCRFNGSQFEAMTLPLSSAGKTALPGKLAAASDGMPKILPFIPFRDKAKVTFLMIYKGV